MIQPTTCAYGFLVHDCLPLQEFAPQTAIGYMLSLCPILQHQHLLMAFKRCKLALLLHAHHGEDLGHVVSLCLMAV